MYPSLPSHSSNKCFQFNCEEGDSWNTSYLWGTTHTTVLTTLLIVGVEVYILLLGQALFFVMIEGFIPSTELLVAQRGTRGAANIKAVLGDRGDDKIVVLTKLLHGVLTRLGEGEGTVVHDVGKDNLSLGEGKMLPKAITRTIDEGDEGVGVDIISGSVEESLRAERVGLGEDVSTMMNTINSNSYGAALRDDDIMTKAGGIAGNDIVVHGDTHGEGDYGVKAEGLLENGGGPTKLVDMLHGRSHVITDTLSENFLGLTHNLGVNSGALHQLKGSPGEKGR